jgi:membrane-bound lytic murein transglycosylase A
MRNYLLLLVCCLALLSCSKEQKPEPTDQLLTEASFSDLHGWDNDDMLGGYTAFMRSCQVILKQKGEFLGSAEIKINLADYQSVCRRAAGIMPTKFKDFVKENFVPYAVMVDGSPEGKFTAYYEAELHASYTPDETYKYPVYGRPYDLVEVNLHDFDASLPSRRLVGRVENNRLIPYYSRAEISAQGLKAPVIVWADSDIDVYIMQIQGSAVAHMKDGSDIRIAFADSNGLPFKGIGSILLSKGLLDKGKASMGSIKKWLKENPGLALVNMNENQRYIFHRLGNPEGPVGAQGVPLTAGRSLAVDKSYVPLGTLLWLETTRPEGAELNRLVVAQDIGSAIKGGIRGDFFWGSGGDEILELAGKMNARGRYYVLMPKPQGEN